MRDLEQTTDISLYWGVTRQTFLACSLAATAGAQQYPIVDIHQHVPYTGRNAAELVEHQRNMGIGKTILLPAGRAYALAAGIGGNEAALSLAKQHPGSFYFFANELPDIAETRITIEKYLKAGAIGIGEQKFHVECDSAPVQLIASIAREYKVPVLLHFEHGAYNLHFERFYRVLEKFPDVNFIGHAQTWWGNIDKSLEPANLYPKAGVTPGGLTDKWLSDYPNMFGDLSAGSGLNALLRDEEHAREFLKRHQNKLLYGSDCSDRRGEGDECSGAKQIAAIRRLLPDAAAQKKIFHDNAARILKLA